MTDRPEVAGEETPDDPTSSKTAGGGGTDPGVEASGDTVVQVGSLASGSGKKPAMGRSRQTTSRRRRSAAAKATVKEPSNEPKPQIPKPTTKGASEPTKTTSDDLMAAFDRHEIPDGGVKGKAQAESAKATQAKAEPAKPAPAKAEAKKPEVVKPSATKPPASSAKASAAKNQATKDEPASVATKTKPSSAPKTTSTSSASKGNPMAMQSPAPSAKVSAPSPAASPVTKKPTEAPSAPSQPQSVGLAAAAVAASATRSSAATRRTRKARLRLSRIDPWSVMKTVFLFSVAFGIMGWIAVYVLWEIMSVSGIFDAINSSVMGVISSPNNTEGWRIEDYFSANKVLGFAAFIGVVNAIITTALGTLGAFLYNLSANILGGLELTLAED